MLSSCYRTSDSVPCEIHGEWIGTGCFSPSFFSCPMLNIIRLLQHTHVSVPPEMCDSPDQAEYSNRFDSFPQTHTGVKNSVVADQWEFMCVGLGMQKGVRRARYNGQESMEGRKDWGLMGVRKAMVGTWIWAVSPGPYGQWKHHPLRHLGQLFMEPSDFYDAPVFKVLHFIRNVGLIKG
jgi:hypothetical protein